MLKGIIQEWIETAQASGLPHSRTKGPALSLCLTAPDGGLFRSRAGGESSDPDTGSMKHSTGGWLQECDESM